MLRTGALVGLGRVDAAIAATDGVSEAPPAEAIANWYWTNRCLRARALAKGGRRREAELLAVQADASGRAGIFVDLAAVYGALGDKKRALSLLERSYRSRDSANCW
jgi:hypothetical protein